MKRFVLALAVCFLAAGAAFAQWGNPQGAAQPITVEGTLQLQNGEIAVSSGSAVYFAPVLTRYIGFIDGLKEGARVSVSGYASGNVLQVSQLNVGGKTYDFLAAGNGGGYGNGWCGGAGSGAGSGCYGRGGFAFGGGGRGRRW